MNELIKVWLRGIAFLVTKEIFQRIHGESESTPGTAMREDEAHEIVTSHPDTCVDHHGTRYTFKEWNDLPKQDTPEQTESKLQSLQKQIEELTKLVAKKLK